MTQIRNQRKRKKTISTLRRLIPEICLKDTQPNKKKAFSEQRPTTPGEFLSTSHRRYVLQLVNYTIDLDTDLW